jgi:hypothetical protein
MIPYAWFMPGESGVGGDYDWTTTAGLTLGLDAGSLLTGAFRLLWRLEFAVFSVKSIGDDHVG